jgi:transcriptional regulator with XRE-family HTH domain
MRTLVLAMTRPNEKQPNPLRAARERAGLSQFQLAVRAGLHLATVGLAERGARVSPETSAKLAAALGVTAEELRP